jgi:CubicO group peptidase (beta-lactamase class C family)
MTRLAIVAVVGACATTPIPSPHPPSFEAALDAYYTRICPPDEPGAAVLVMKNDRVVFAHAYGLADMKTRTAVTTRTLFNLGSISKTFVANAVLILQARHKLSVDDNLATYFPEFKHPELAKRVTLANLLTHTSGLPDLRDVNHNRDFFMTAKDPENWHPITQADALAFEPGSQFAYSNPAFNGLALIVEQVSGMRWQQFVHDNIFVPAGMMTSTITDGPQPDHGVAHAYDQTDTGWQEDDYGEFPTFAAAGNGGVWSSVEELAAYERAIEKHVFLDEASLADARTVKTFPSWTSDKPPAIGWSWFVRDTPGKPRIIGHTGSQGGFTATYQTIPDKKLFFVVLSGSEREQHAYGTEILRQLELANWLDR